MRPKSGSRLSTRLLSLLLAVLLAFGPAASQVIFAADSELAQQMQKKPLSQRAQAGSYLRPLFLPSITAASRPVYRKVLSIL